MLGKTWGHFCNSVLKIFKYLGHAKRTWGELLSLFAPTPSSMYEPGGMCSLLQLQLPTQGFYVGWTPQVQKHPS